MNELLITRDDNTTAKCYAVYYTSQGRYYIIYTERNKDENGYVILHLSKVLKVVNSTSDGNVVPTGKYIGIEIDSYDDSVKNDIKKVIANLQGDTSVEINYLPLDTIEGINIKSGITFKITEEIVNAIIKENVPSNNVEESVPSFEQPAPAVEPLKPEEEEPVSLPDYVPAPVEVPNVPSFDDDIPMPAVAPNPFEAFQTPALEPEVQAEPEVKPLNPFEEMQKQRDEEMIKNLANDNMQDIAPSPVLSVDYLEKNEEIDTPVLPEINIPSFDPIELEKEEPTPALEPEVQAEPVLEETKPEVQVEAIGGNSFVDSIVADVSDILDEKAVAESNAKVNNDESDYKQLYHDELEKTIELEKELKELHNKLNNIKNIVE